MKLKLLLFLAMLAGILHAQEPEPEPYRQLLITEIYTQNPNRNYCEITNMGDQTINLGEFKLGVLNPWAGPPIYDVWNDPFVPQSSDYVIMLPEVDLAPNESFVVSTAYDFGMEQYKKSPYALGAVERSMKIDIYPYADLLLHQPETNGDETDSITSGRYHYQVMGTWDGRNTFYLEHHYGMPSDTAAGDSAVVDQFGGVFDDDGKNFSQAYDVAGVLNATSHSVCVRKFKIKTGNLDFANARGLAIEDSEWMPIEYPSGHGAWRDTWWGVGNHGDYVLDENTLEPKAGSSVEVDFAGKEITVPWGTRRLDDVMRQMVRKEGVFWHYRLNSIQQDSMYESAQTGDTLIVIVCGSEYYADTFNIAVEEPTTDANIVIPVKHTIGYAADESGPIVGSTQAGILDWPRVTQHESGPDTITGAENGIPFAMRTDTLLKYLEKAPNATWEFEFVDGVERPDLKEGDKLVVTAENGDVKEYYIQMRIFVPSSNALLGAITWPDIPDFYRDIFGWVGDTIPNFVSSITDYKVTVPIDVDGIPALKAVTASINASVKVERAKSLYGTLEDRTATFTVTAEDDTTIKVYKVELIKQLDPDKIQPFYADPFLSEFIDLDLWFNQYAEVANPGNQPLDLSNYMFTMLYGGDPVQNITVASTAEDFASRYIKYVPGYKWVGEEQWAVTPGILEPDLAINPIVQAGDVFAMSYQNRSGEGRFSYITRYEDLWQYGGYRVDINFSLRPNDNGLNRYNLQNPWGDDISMSQCPVQRPSSHNFMIWKILNDSVTLGLKPATDPNDFELIDNVGPADGSGAWRIEGMALGNRDSWRRKPEIWQGHPEPGFAETWEESEWVYWDVPYWNAVGHPMKQYGVSWFHSELAVAEDIGRHTMISPTHYMSTVTSTVYKVDAGYKLEDDLQIRGAVTGTTVNDFLANLNKRDPGQTLTVKAKANGMELTGDDLLSMNDTLFVYSADSSNVTDYFIEVSENGLSSDALLTSDRYDIEVVSQPTKSGSEAEEDGIGTITGFEYGTQVRTILNSVNVPAGATMDIVDANGAYVPLQIQNFDSVTPYVDVTVSAGIYFDVLAENGITRIVYQLLPQSSPSDAFVLSDVYTVKQADNLIKFIPGGTNSEIFLSNLIPATGATMKLVNKMGLERTEGDVARDDELVVTSANGEVTRVYHLAMLTSPYSQSEGIYLAYVTSQFYSIDQVANKIMVDNSAGPVSISEFMGRLVPHTDGATLQVIDDNGDGLLNGQDMVKVTALDSRFVAMYSIEFTTSSRMVKNNINLYPNPTTGRVKISGLEVGGRVQVFNTTGAVINDFKVSSNVEEVSLNDQPAGMYLIRISNANSVHVGHYKLMKGK